MKFSFLILFLSVSPSAAQNFNYPLHVGDTWEYFSESNDEYYRVSISGDTIMQNGKKYMIISNSYYGVVEYQRKSGDSIYFYHNQQGKEYLLYDFSSRISRVISSFPSQWSDYDTSEVYLSFVGSDMLFSLNRTVYHFLIDNVVGALDDEDFRQVSDSLGLSYRRGFIFSDVLTGALLNGVQYGVITDVSLNTIKIPQFYSLSQNYPNPFNPTTIIPYELPEQSLVTIKVFNILGLEITTLVSENQEAGAKSAVFEASELPSGMYFYRITAVNDTRAFTQTNKMLVLK